MRLYSFKSLAGVLKVICFPLICSFNDPTYELSLQGEWRFKIDSLDKGVEERWFATALPETIQLSGSMLRNGKGNKVTLQTKWTGSIYDSSWYFNPRKAKYRQPDYLDELQPNKHLKISQ